jgi:hypothetical protein
MFGRNLDAPRTATTNGRHQPILPASLRSGNPSENVFYVSTDRILSHKAKNGGGIFLPLGDLDFQNLDRPVAERITSRFPDAS